MLPKEGLDDPFYVAPIGMITTVFLATALGDPSYFHELHRGRVYLFTGAALHP